MSVFYDELDLLDRLRMSRKRMQGYAPIEDNYSENSCGVTLNRVGEPIRESWSETNKERAERIAQCGPVRVIVANGRAR